MSRIYLTANSDSRKTKITSTGRKRVSATLFYGSADNSRFAGSIGIKWDDQEKPTLFIEFPKDEGLKIVLNGDTV